MNSIQVKLMVCLTVDVLQSDIGCGDGIIVG